MNTNMQNYGSCVIRLLSWQKYQIKILHDDVKITGYNVYSFMSYHVIIINYHGINKCQIEPLMNRTLTSLCCLRSRAPLCQLHFLNIYLLCWYHRNTDSELDRRTVNAGHHKTCIK
jgi:hypothetical protein